MNININIMIFILLSFVLLSSRAIAPPLFNLSHFIYPKTRDEFRPQPSVFFKDVLGAIVNSENWELNDVRVSKLDAAKVMYGNLQRFDIQFQWNKRDLVFKIWDEVSVWKRFKEIEGEFEAMANEVSSRAVLDSIQIEGPFELLVAGDDEMSLMLPWNTSHAGLRRILVPEDITVEVKNAHEVSLFHSSDLGLEADRSFLTHIEQSQLGFLPQLTCIPLLPIRVSGSALVAAFRTRNPGAHIASILLSQDTIELLPEKCYSRCTLEKQQCPIKSLRLRIKLVEKVLRSLFAEKLNRNGKYKANIEASTVFRFQLEMERDIRTNDTQLTTMAAWRTRPTVEHVWFEVLARIERKRLKPLVITKMKPFVGVDSAAWSNLMANISFTKLSSVLVAPEALTLDVK